MLFFCFSLYAQISFSADEIVAPKLLTDPFINPLQTPQVETENNIGKVNNTAEAVDKEPRQSFLWQPEIRGIIQSKDIAVVNIGGEMIELGNDYEGYRLIKVKEQSVVFEKNGKQIPITLDPDPETKKEGK